ncbi:MAG: radical SAM protein [Spirochaetales bacterium]|jgi:lysine 2,3-aminomutase|nr:radical SAM protein [Spirochaetales bacterium]
MHRTERAFDFTFVHSGKTGKVSLRDLVRKSNEFLEYYATPSLTSSEFCRIIGTGSGREKLDRLMHKCGYGQDPAGFFEKLIAELTLADQKSKQINGTGIPYRFAVALLDILLPGHGFITIQNVDQLKAETHLEVPDNQRSDLQKVIEMYPVRLSYHTIRQMLVSRDVAYQYMPFVEELDPVGHTNTWIGQFHEGLLEQMYQNRVIFLLNMTCPVYCRYCFRKKKLSRNEDNPTVEDVKKAIEHVGTTPTIKEIIVTGGEPFLSRKNMRATIDGLMEIDHVQTLRLATRSVAYYPDLFLQDERKYLKFLKQKNLELQQCGKRMEIATHFIHPDEVSPESLEIITEMVNSGITVYVQTPFLKGCNDQGPELQKLFCLLRGAGAEMHYIYIPCSPIHGNSVYWSPLSEGIDVAEYLRAHLSDRSIPKICTATPIGKMEWYTSGWAVEQVEGKDDFIWIRTPYTPDYFKSFAPVANDLPNIRVNSEGTLDIQYMANIGKDSYFLGSRPLRITRTAVPMAVPENLSVRNIAELLKGPSVVRTGLSNLRRVHETRVEITADFTEAEIGYIAQDDLITDVVVAAGDDVPGSLYKIKQLAEILKPIAHVNALRLRSLAFNYAPQEFTPTVIQRLAELNCLTVASPLRLEVETWFLKAEEINSEHLSLVRRMNNRGITVYSNTALLGGVNDQQDEIFALTFALRKAGIEFHHLYVAGLALQNVWNSEHPIDMYDVIDIASKIRREGSGRAGPRYIIQTPIGEVYYGLTSSFFPEEKRVLMKLESYDLKYYRQLDPEFSLPQDIWENNKGELMMPVPGLVSSIDFRI